MNIDCDNTLPGIYKNNPNKRHETNINESDEFRNTRKSRPSSSFRNTKIFRLSTDKSSIDHENFDKILKEYNSPINLKNNNYRFQNNNLMNDYDHQEKKIKIKLSKDKNNDGNYLFNKSNNLNLITSNNYDINL